MTGSLKRLAQGCERGFDGCNVTEAPYLLSVPYADGVDVRPTASSRTFPNVEVKL